MLKPNDLYTSPNQLAEHYSQFRVAERLLLTGHSHQAWPDCTFAAQQQAWRDAADFVDEKWETAFKKADEVRDGYRRLLNDPSAEMTLGASTFELVVRLLSALPVSSHSKSSRQKIVTTDGEFYTLRRLFDRLSEEQSLEIVRVSAESVDDISAKLVAEIDDRTAAVFVSSVLFRNSRIVPELPAVAAACDQMGAVCVIDAYHHLNVVPFSIAGLENAYILGGGYKYCQLGEGNCALRLPPDCSLRPIATGWFSEFAELSNQQESGKTNYGIGGARFAGATYDPTSHYRAAATFQFFQQQQLTVELLREVSQHQLGLLAHEFDALNIDPKIISRDTDTPLKKFGGFLALTSPHAGEICTKLKQLGVLTDSRSNVLRFGPAPFLSDQQLRNAMQQLGKSCE